ncbi:hypothetical protein AB1Y20_009456 [Prymnesium parvum]|uniref:Uncharacterized protein n=1 Tax=Prymnesium parvum TaxID=97485 RepID=A0AB34K1N2_PRYPA
MYITRSCVVWSVGGVLLTDPSPAQLSTLRAGIDYALVAPPRSKPDQWGEIHCCPFPVTLTYDTDEPNAAACVRDIELRYPCAGAARASTPLFADRAGQPYSHGFLGALLHAALTFLYGSSVASLYTFHSYRRQALQAPRQGASPAFADTPALAVTPTSPQPAQPAPPIDRPAAGATAFIPRECWPDEPCLEHNGAGWTVLVRSVTRHTAVVDFPY